MPLKSRLLYIYTFKESFSELELVREFCNHFRFNFENVMNEKFTEIVPVSHRPYGRLYAY